MVDRVGYAPTTSRMSSEHSTIELTVQINFLILIKKSEIFWSFKF